MQGALRKVYKKKTRGREERTGEGEGWETEGNFFAVPGGLINFSLEVRCKCRKRESWGGFGGGGGVLSSNTGYGRGVEKGEGSIRRRLLTTREGGAAREKIVQK